MLEKIIKWFRCKMCCQSKCSVGEDNAQEQLHVDYNSILKKKKKVHFV